MDGEEYDEGSSQGWEESSDEATEASDGGGTKVILLQAIPS